MSRKGHRHQGSREGKPLRGYAAYRLSAASIDDALGEVDEGIAALERGLADWGPGYILTLAGPPVDKLRGDPRFRAIMESVGDAGPWATADQSGRRDLA